MEKTFVPLVLILKMLLLTKGALVSIISFVGFFGTQRKAVISIHENKHFRYLKVGWCLS